MARLTTTLANFGGNVLPDVYVEARFIRAMRRKLFIASLGRPSTMPEGAGKDVRWNVLVKSSTFYDDVTAVIGTEGNDPAQDDFTTNAPAATLVEFGRSYEYTKFLKLTAVSGTLDEIIDEVGHQAGAVLDRRSAKALAATTQSTDEGVSFTAEALRKAVAKLKGARGTISGENVVTEVDPHPLTPGGQFYCAILSSEQAYDMLGEGAPTWAQSKSDDFRRAVVTPFMDDLSSELYGAIVKVSNNVPRVATPTPDDDQALIFGKDALLVAALDTAVIQPRVIITPPEMKVDKPARNLGTIAWWALYEAVLSENFRCQEVLTDATGIG